MPKTPASAKVKPTTAFWDPPLVDEAEAAALWTLEDPDDTALEAAATLARTMVAIWVTVPVV
jgi:hypothetical protein